MDRKLIRPETVEEALSEREKYGRDALPIAGGQSLLVLLRNKLIDPKDLDRPANPGRVAGNETSRQWAVHRRDDDDS